MIKMRYKTNQIVFFLTMGFPTTSFGHALGSNLTRCWSIQSEGHQELYNEVGFLNSTKHPVGFETTTFQYQWMPNPSQLILRLCETYMGTFVIMGCFNKHFLKWNYPHVLTCRTFRTLSPSTTTSVPQLHWPLKDSPFQLLFWNQKLSQRAFPEIQNLSLECFDLGPKWNRTSLLPRGTLWKLILALVD